MFRMLNLRTSGIRGVSDASGETAKEKTLWRLLANRSRSLLEKSCSSVDDGNRKFYNNV